MLLKKTKNVAEIKNEIRNLWLSDQCAFHKCVDCPKEKSLVETTHFCKCSCHNRSLYKKNDYRGLDFRK